MKAIIASTGTPLIHLETVADSAIARETMPLFLPDLGVEWYGKVCLAFRISKLGKSISRRFVMRYVEEVTAVCLLTVGADTQQGRELKESGVLDIIDCRITIGRWLPLDPQARDITLTAQQQMATFSLADIDIAGIVSEISTYATLKSGDMILVPSAAIDVELKPDTYIRAAIDSTNCLQVKVK